MKTEERKASNLIAGLDEVGMGCLAGPVVICVVAFPEDKVKIAGVRDSKSCPITARERLIKRIVAEASFIGLGYSTVKVIHKKGIPGAWQDAATMALKHAPRFKRLVVDGNRAVVGHPGPQVVQPKADVTCWQVSAASIVAKVLRDAHMKCLGEFYRGYGWDTNSGYGTKQHIAAILSKGETRFHRTKFLRKLYEQNS